MRAASARSWIWRASSAALFAVFLPNPVQADDDALKPRLAVTEVLMQVDVNQQGLDETVVLLRAPDGALFISGEDLERFRLRRPAAPALEHEGKPWYALGELPGASFRVDARRQTLALTAPPEAFDDTLAAVPALRYPPPVLPQPGGFLNYNVSATRVHSAQSESGLFEAGFFSRNGVFVTGGLANELGERSSWVRLESTYTVDFPERLETLRVGDTISVPGAWGLPARLGGVQYGTNFSTRPGFVRFPIQTAGASAALPSTVDVFVNNALVSRSSVPPGPFSITNIPMVSGSGDVRLVVRDFLGREHVIVQPFYGSAELLKAGLDDWSIEAGAEREAFGERSNEYNGALTSGTWRRGLTDTLTGELRAEAQEHAQAAGAAALARVGLVGMLNGSYAASHSDAGTGHLIGYGFEHSSRVFSGGFQTQLTTPEFRQSGLGEGELPRRRQSVASLGVSFGALGSTSAAYVIQEFRDRPKQEVATLSWSVPLQRFANLTLAASRSYGPLGATTVFAALAIPLGNLTSASLVSQRTRSELTGETTDAYSALLQKSLPLGEGYGYRLQARDTDLLAGAALNTSRATWTAELSHARNVDQDALRLGVSGGIGATGGHAFLSRTITDSFGVVRVADYPGVRVLHENQPVATTDERGYAVLPRLRPYDRNQVSIDQRDLPFDARVEGLRLHAVPYFRSGVLIDFPVRRVRAATLRIILEDGSLMPSGALVRVQGGEGEFPVALRGEVYLEGLQDSNTLIATWRGQRCTLEVRYPRTDDPLPDLGEHLCRGVKP